MSTVEDEPDVLDLSLPEITAVSRRLAAQPGLPAQVLDWQATLGEQRRHLRARARSLSTPRLWPDTIGSLASTAWRIVAAGAPEAPLALLMAAAAGAGVPIAPPAPERRVIERAQQLVRAGGPAYVKLGQFIASAQGLLPDAWVQAFAWCRDDAPLLEPGVARRVVERELGTGSVLDFDDDALAAGSIGQVHTARLRDGTRVVVKVRRPGSKRRFEQEIESLALVAAAADRLAPAARVANLPAFVELFAELALNELDFRLEALNAAELAAVFDHAGLEEVRVPLPVAGLVTERVLVMPFVDGVPYDQAGRHFGPMLDGEQLLRTSIRAVLESTLFYGIAHGDLHAGNVLVPSPDRFNLLDFGICARLNLAQRAALMRFLAAFADANAAGMVDALAEFDAFAPGTDRHALIAELAVEVEVLEHRDGGAVTFDRLGSALSSVLRIVAASGFAMPTDLVLFFKNLLYLSSFAAAVAPRCDLLGAISEVLDEIAQAHPGQVERLLSVGVPETS